MHISLAQLKSFVALFAYTAKHVSNSDNDGDNDKPFMRGWSERDPVRNSRSA
jgi:hypothetical protein